MVAVNVLVTLALTMELMKVDVFNALVRKVTIQLKQRHSLGKTTKMEKVKEKRMGRKDQNLKKNLLKKKVKQLRLLPNFFYTF